MFDVLLYFSGSLFICFCPDSVFWFWITVSSLFGSVERHGADDEMIINLFSPVAPGPGWLLPRRQQRELLSEPRRTPASGPEGHGSAAAVAPPQTPNPTQNKTYCPRKHITSNKHHYFSFIETHFYGFRLLIRAAASSSSFFFCLQKTIEWLQNTSKCLNHYCLYMRSKRFHITNCFRNCKDWIFPNTSKDLMK